MPILRCFIAAATLGVAAILSVTAQAADLGGRYGGERKWESEPSYDQGGGPGWMVRFRGLYVLPDAASSNWRGAPVTHPDLSIDSSVVPEADISYFFTNHIAAEVIIGVTSHDIDGEGDLRGKIGDVWLLPATALLQYHFELV